MAYFGAPFVRVLGIKWMKSKKHLHSDQQARAQTVDEEKGRAIDADDIDRYPKSVACSAQTPVCSRREKFANLIIF